MSLQSDAWPRYNPRQPRYLLWNGNVRGTGRGPRAATCAFWNLLMPLLGRENRDTTCIGVRVSLRFNIC